MATTAHAPLTQASSTAQRWRLAILPLAATALLAPSAAALAAGTLRTAPSLCTADEQTLFSCRLQRKGQSGKNAGKLVSVCGAPDLASANAFLSYRIGRPGQLELVYPATRTGSLQAFTRWHYDRYQTDYWELYFSQGGYDYTVFSHYADGSRRHGVSVARQGKDELLTELACAPPVTQQLQKLDAYVACQPDRMGMHCAAP